MLFPAPYRSPTSLLRQPARSHVRIVVAKQLHDRGIKVMVDIVPNHTSNRHAWFLEALAAPRGSPARDRYIFRDGKGPVGSAPPNDWQSVFGGSAWTRVPDGQWYLHLFAPEQPDLNWHSADVRAGFLHTLRFWADQGVDGFRVDVASYLAKDLSDPEPTWEELTGGRLDRATPVQGPRRGARDLRGVASGVR